MSKDLGLAIAAGLTSAVIFMLVGDVLPPLVYLAPLPLFAAGLGLGLTAVLVAGGIALGAVVATGGFGALLPFGGAAVLPAVVVVRQALLWRTTAAGTVEWYPPGLLLGWLTAMAALALLGAAVLLPAHDEGLEGLVRELVARGIDALGVREPLRQTLQALWVPFLPAMVTSAWLMVAVGNAAVAQGLLRRGRRNLRPSPSYRSLALPDWMGPALLAAMLAAWVAEGSVAYLARNLAVVLLVPFLLLGLAGVHQAAAKRGNGAMLLALFYGVFVMMFGWAVVAVAGYGLVRHWTTLRRRMGGGSQEEE